MNTRFRNLKNDLKDLEDSGSLQSEPNMVKATASEVSRYILLIAFLATFLFYAGSKINISGSDVNPVGSFIESMSQPNENLLIEMGEWMQQMGYGEISREELIRLRSFGVTATYTSAMQDLGYELSLEDLVDLQQADVSATFTRMMKELGYELSKNDLITLKRNDVTAHFTSNMLDLGYTTQELTKENLSRLRSVGVTQSLTERLIRGNDGEKPTIDELIRYRISNQ